MCLEPGEHRGPVRVERPLTLWGPPVAVVRAADAGTTVELAADGSALLGVTVDGSGSRFDLLDAAVAVRADDVRVEGVRVRNALFGILAEQCQRAVLRGNRVEGDPGKVLGMRGDGIRLWEVRDSKVEDNHLLHSRDLVVWYSPGNRFVGNRVEHSRYGTHFMYSHRNHVERNRYDANVVGVFIMYSREITLRGNVLARSAGAAGMGLGAKESGDLVVEENLFPGNGVALYLDTSPLHLDERNRIERNLFAMNQTAVAFHGVAERNHFHGNAFRGNHQQVRVEGRGDARDAAWRGNQWDDYRGYDLDGDGFGDLPYELRSLSQQLAARNPALRFFRGAPAMALVELVGELVPIFQPRTLLVDPRPRVESPPGLAAAAGDARGG